LQSNEISRRQRLEAVFAGEEPDRTPILGGWIACAEHICVLADATADEYWDDPEKVSIRAYKELGSDGLIDLYMQKKPGEYRFVDNHSFWRAVTHLSLDDTIARIDDMPSAKEIEAEFDFDASYEAFKTALLRRQELCGDMVWMPAQWGGGARISWYADFGYENFFCIVGMYPDRAKKLLDVGGAQGRNQLRVAARAVEEGLYPHAVLLGEDICTQRGPMISPAFMEEHYAPNLRRGLEPLLDVGCKPVWHSDGDVRQMMDMLIDCGVQGFQGFQQETGLNIEYVARKRTRDGDPLLIFGPLAVTSELPVCTPDQIREKVRHAIDICRGNADLVMFTANTINPDVPLDNIIAMHEAVGALG